MRVKLIKSVIVDSRHISVGDEVEVDEIVGKYLIRRGMAVAVEDKPQKKGRKRGAQNAD